MYISSIIKFRTTSERDAAIALDKAVNDVSSNSVGTLEDIKAGVERASWYSSCLFDKYDDVCSGLKGEDRRFIKAIFEIYKRRDIIADMIRMYIEAELKTADRSEIQSIDAKLAKNLVGYSGGKLTKTAIANSLSILIVNAFHFKNGPCKQFCVTATVLNVIAQAITELDNKTAHCQPPVLDRHIPFF
ncbi:hypothetical protein [Erwinia pyrifoliae]|uniref:Uncharacterized protein n=1 Tax=Erwinia pyrifoliae TaxID=79967 RepID=A0ABY5X868_ERWPY|nr:hypothetical protein [Erwinia pyrifoliae]UWS33547.1 hypothetical protein NYP84_18640 [Erwinia pyrifoliae]